MSMSMKHENHEDIEEHGMSMKGMKAVSMKT
jgi:hypothetical protein